MSRITIDRRTVVMDGDNALRRSITFGAMPFLQWILLHPTKDDSAFNASTLKVLKFSEHFGFYGAKIVTLYPYRVNTNAELRQQKQHHGSRGVGGFELIKGAPLVVAWGDKADCDLDLLAVSLDRIKSEGFIPKCLSRTAKGYPVQPTGVSFPGPWKRLEDLQSYRPPLNVESRCRK